MQQSPSFPSTPPNSSATSTSDVAQSVADRTQEKVGQVVDQTQRAAVQVTEQAKTQATSQLESQKARAVDSLYTVSQALRQTSQHLREQDSGPIGEYVDQAAEKVESLTNHVRTRDVPQLLNETQDFARRRPGVFVGLALAMGFVGARFLMSSGQRASAQRTSATTVSSTGNSAQTDWSYSPSLSPTGDGAGSAGRAAY